VAAVRLLGRAVALVDHADGVAALAAVHPLRVQRCLTAIAAAQLAQPAAALVDVDALADERRALAFVAAADAGRAGEHAAAQQLALEIAGTQGSSKHGPVFGGDPSAPPNST
jgi:hypothetical protein